MGKIGVTEAARRLGVGVQRIHQRIADGSLPAVVVGSQWVIDEASVSQVSESNNPGRPLSERSTWAILAASQDDKDALGRLSPTERHRANERLQLLLGQASSTAAPSEAQVHACAMLLRSLLRNRAARKCYRASPRDLPDLRRDGRLTLSGLSHPTSGIGAIDIVEGYTTEDKIEPVVESYLLSPVTVNREANVVLHVTSAAIPPGLAPLLLAADLAEHRRPREEVRAVEILRAITQQRPSVTDDRALTMTPDEASP